MKTIKHLSATIIRAASQGDEESVTITTPARDLVNDTIDPMGMETDGYLRGSGAVFLNHDYTQLPVGKTTAIDRSPQGMRARFRWLDDPRVEPVKIAFHAGVLGASVGFIADASRPNEHGGQHFTKTRLTEWSLTGNPANQTCQRMYKALDAIRQADGARSKVRLTRGAVRLLRALAECPRGSGCKYDSKRATCAARDCPMYAGLPRKRLSGDALAAVVKTVVGRQTSSDIVKRAAAEAWENLTGRPR